MKRIICSMAALGLALVMAGGALKAGGALRADGAMPVHTQTSHVSSQSC